MKTAMHPVCIRISQLPRVLGISEYEISKRIGKPQITIQNIYKRGYKPGFELLFRLCAEFNIDANWLITGSEKSQIRHTKKQTTNKH